MPQRTRTTGGPEVKVPCACSVVHVRTCWRCCATLRATAPCIHSFIHSHTSLDLEPRGLRARACRVLVPRACLHGGAARSQCVYCGACGTFSRVGLARVGVPWQRPARSRTPTLRVDTSPPRGDHIHHHTASLSSTDLPGRRSTEDPGAPLLSGVCVKPLLSAASRIWSCEDQKNSEAARQDEKNYWRQMPKTTIRKSFHLAGTKQLGKCRKKRPKYATTSKSAKIPKSWTPKTKYQERRTRRGTRPKPQPSPAGHGTSEKARRRTPTRTRGPQGTATTKTGRTNTEKPQQGEKRTTSRRDPGRDPGRRRRPKLPSALEEQQRKPPMPNTHSGLRHNFGARHPFPVHAF